MAAVLRGEVHWADLSPVVGSEQGGRRPVLIMQADPLNRSATTIGLAITSAPQRVDYPLVVRLERGEAGLRKVSWVKINQVRTLAMRRLVGRLGILSGQRLAEVEDALLDVLAIEPR